MRPFFVGAVSDGEVEAIDPFEFAQGRLSITAALKGERPSNVKYPAPAIRHIFRNLDAPVPYEKVGNIFREKRKFSIAIDRPIC